MGFVRRPNGRRARGMARAFHGAGSEVPPGLSFGKGSYARSPDSMEHCSSRWWPLRPPALTAPSHRRRNRRRYCPGGAPRPLIIVNQMAEDESSADFTVTPTGGYFRMGKHGIVFPRNVICDPATSSYGPDVWDEDCEVLREPIRIHAELRQQDGREWVDFTPAAALQAVALVCSSGCGSTWRPMRPALLPDARADDSVVTRDRGAGHRRVAVRSDAENVRESLERCMRIAASSTSVATT